MRPKPKYEEPMTATSMDFVWLVSMVAIVIVFILMGGEGHGSEVITKTEGMTIIQETKDPKSPNIVDKKNLPKDKGKVEIRQKSEGKQSPNVVSGGDVTIIYEEKK